MLLQDSPKSVHSRLHLLAWLDNKSRQKGVPSALSPRHPGLPLPRTAIPRSISKRVALWSLAGRLPPVWVFALEHLPSACPPPPLLQAQLWPAPSPSCPLLHPCSLSPSWQSLQPSLLLAVQGASAAASLPPILPGCLRLPSPALFPLSPHPLPWTLQT